MEKNQVTYVELRENIDKEIHKSINNLKDYCIEKDDVALKLELDYKLGIDNPKNSGGANWKINEFMYYDKGQLVGYLGISSFGELGTPIELNGMVHPNYRRQGIFTKLFELAIFEWKRRNSEDMLMLCDRKSNSGKSFINKFGGVYKNSEYEMYLNKEKSKKLKNLDRSITFRKAKNEDAIEISRQNSIYFDIEANEFMQGMIMPEEEEKRGMKIYIAEKDGRIIGKVHNQLISGIGGIYGLGVLPEYRGKGLGRKILLMAIEYLKEEKADEIMLQVETENSNALNLYKSCGFEETSVMDYYELKREVLV